MTARNMSIPDREPILQIGSILMASNMVTRAFSRCNKAQYVADTIEIIKE